MVGLCAAAEDEFLEQDDGFIGQVRAHGEYWRAFSPIKIAKGQQVHVTGREGLTLHVDRNGNPEKQPASIIVHRESKPNAQETKS